MLYGLNKLTDGALGVRGPALRVRGDEAPRSLEGRVRVVHGCVGGVRTGARLRE